MPATAAAAAAYLAPVESVDCRRKLSMPAAIAKIGSAAITNSSAGCVAARKAATLPARLGATTALAISKPPVEQRFTARSSGIPCGSSQAQNAGQAESREKIQAKAPSVKPL